MIVSKIGADSNPGECRSHAGRTAAGGTRASVHDNLSSLGLEQIPVVNLRRMDASLRIPVPADQNVDLDDQLAQMLAMKNEGLIGAIGLSSITIDIARRALPAGIVCVQNTYSLVDRSDKPTLQLSNDNNIAWVPYVPLGSAFPGFPKVVDEPVVQKIAQTLGVTAFQMGLAGLLNHSGNARLMPGTSSVEHLEANIAAGSIDLDSAAVALLHAVPTRGQ